MCELKNGKPELQASHQQRIVGWWAAPEMANYIFTVTTGQGSNELPLEKPMQKLVSQTPPQPLKSSYNTQWYLYQAARSGFLQEQSTEGTCFRQLFCTCTNSCLEAFARSSIHSLLSHLLAVPVGSPCLTGGVIRPEPHQSREGSSTISVLYQAQYAEDARLQWKGPGVDRLPALLVSARQ
jgi:hypothetical protein